MNIELKLDDVGWRTWIKQAVNALAASNTTLKKAMLIVWPRESGSHFREEMGFAGPWAPWKPSYRKHMERIGKGDNRLLQDIGTLRQQTTLDPEMVQLPNGLKVISPTPYSGYLDEGTPNMVARPFMWLGEDAQENLSKIFAHKLWGEAGGAD